MKEMIFEVFVMFEYEFNERSDFCGVGYCICLGVLL